MTRSSARSGSGVSLGDGRGPRTSSGSRPRARRDVARDPQRLRRLAVALDVAESSMVLKSERARRRRQQVGERRIARALPGVDGDEQRPDRRARGTRRAPGCEPLAAASTAARCAGSRAPAATSAITRAQDARIIHSAARVDLWKYTCWNMNSRAEQERLDRGDALGAVDGRGPGRGCRSPRPRLEAQAAQEPGQVVVAVASRRSRARRAAGSRSDRRRRCRSPPCARYGSSCLPWTRSATRAARPGRRARGCGARRSRDRAGSALGPGSRAGGRRAARPRTGARTDRGRRRGAAPRRSRRARARWSCAARTAGRRRSAGAAPISSCITCAAPMA